MDLYAVCSDVSTAVRMQLTTQPDSTYGRSLTSSVLEDRAWLHTKRGSNPVAANGSLQLIDCVNLRKKGFAGTGFEPATFGL